jgi:hypothetical protein
MGGRKKQSQRRARQERRFRVRGIRRDPPDVRKLGKALLSLARAEAEQRAQAEHETQQQANDQTEQQREEGSDA